MIRQNGQSGRGYLPGYWRPVDVAVRDLHLGAGLPHPAADGVGDCGCAVASVPAAHQELDRAALRGGAQGGELRAQRR